MFSDPRSRGFGAVDEAVGQLFPDELVDRKQDPPVSPAGDAARVEAGQLAQLGRAGAGVGDAPFEPGLAGGLHLGSQAEQAGWFVGLDAEEVEGGADAQEVGVAASSAHADAPDELVQPPP